MNIPPISRCNLGIQVATVTSSCLLCGDTVTTHALTWTSKPLLYSSRFLFECVRARMQESEKANSLGLERKVDFSNGLFSPVSLAQPGTCTRKGPTQVPWAAKGNSRTFWKSVVTGGPWGSDPLAQFPPTDPPTVFPSEEENEDRPQGGLVQAGSAALSLASHTRCLGVAHPERSVLKRPGRKAAVSCPHHDPGRQPTKDALPESPRRTPR